MLRLEYIARKYHSVEPFTDWVLLTSQCRADGVRVLCRVNCLCGWGPETVGCFLYSCQVGVQGAQGSD